ncbi:MAG TPA: hypothetical protein VKT77_22490 [Chthonomonadaceae bacterium]|nr:hypothetical protein [Chthonomonadaceae bacterium]
MRRRRLALAILASIAAAAGAAILSAIGGERSLTEKAQLVAALGADEITTCWLSNDRMLVVVTDRSENAMGGGWHGRAEEIEVSTGRRTPLTGLTTTFDRLGQSPYWLNPSPGGQYLLFHRVRDDFPLVATVALDGSRFRDGLQPRTLVTAWRDSSHLDLIGEQWEGPIIEVDGSGAEKDRSIPRDGAAAASLLASRRRSAPLEIAVAARSGVPPNRVLWFDLTSTNERDARQSQSGYRSFGIPAPKGFDALNNAILSHGGRTVLYDMNTTAVPEIARRIHALISTFPARAKLYEELWTSDSTGGSLRELGSQQILGPQTRLYLDNIDWSPDNKRISFTFNQALYVLPVPEAGDTDRDKENSHR